MDGSQRVLVIGGTRGTGLLIVNRLVEGGYRVRALARDEARARETLRPEVEIVAGDITRHDTLPPAVREVDHVIFTAGVTQRPAGEALMRATNYDGMVNVLGAAGDGGFRGRFLYMTTLGIRKPSFAGSVLDLVKRHTMHWRRLAEGEIRRSRFDYTIIRAGVLTNDPGGQREIEVSQNNRPLTFQSKISRADVAEVFVQALKHPNTSRTTFDVVWGQGPRHKSWEELFGGLKRDE